MLWADDPEAYQPPIAAARDEHGRLCAASIYACALCRGPKVPGDFYCVSCWLTNPLCPCGAPRVRFGEYCLRVCADCWNNKQQGDIYEKMYLWKPPSPDDMSMFELE